MSEWKDFKIGDICELINGAAFKGSEFRNEGIPVLKIANVKPNKVLLNDLKYVSEEIAEKKKKCKIEYGDILLTLTGNRKDGGPDSWVGKAALFREKDHYMLNQRVCILRANEEIVTKEFLAYYLSSWETQLYFVNHSTSSGGQANISPSIVKDYVIMLPNKKIQQSISTILNTIDEKIMTNEKINRNFAA